MIEGDMSLSVTYKENQRIFKESRKISLVKTAKPVGMPCSVQRSVNKVSKVLIKVAVIPEALNRWHITDRMCKFIHRTQRQITVAVTSVIDLLLKDNKEYSIRSRNTFSMQNKKNFTLASNGVRYSSLQLNNLIAAWIKVSKIYHFNRLSRGIYRIGDEFYHNRGVIHV